TTVAAGSGAARARAARAVVRTVARRTRRAWTGVGAGARIRVVGREHRGIARMAVGTGGAVLVLAGAALFAAGSAGAAAGSPAWAAFIAERPVATRAGAALAAAGLLAVRLPGAAAIGIAVAAGSGADAIGHVPGAERGRIAFRKRVGALLLALLEGLLRLLGRGLAADREAAVRLPAAAAILAHVVEAAQFAALVGGVVAADVARRTPLAVDLHGRLAGLALADHRLQRQRRRRAFLELEFAAQGLDLV